MSVSLLPTHFPLTTTPAIVPDKMHFPSLDVGERTDRVLDGALSLVGLRRKATHETAYHDACRELETSYSARDSGRDDGDAEEDAGCCHRFGLKLGVAKRYTPYPQDDSFYGVYTAVSALEKLEPGTILRWRSIKVKPFPGLEADKLQAWEIAYVTQDEAGKKMTTVTTVIKPPNAKADFILGHLPKTDAAIPQCRTTYSLRQGTAARFASLSEAVFLETWLDQGWIVFVPDYQGQHDAFGSGPIAGRGVLDATRAVMSFHETIGLTTAKPKVAYYGYSSGALASGWTAQLQATYAPELTDSIIGYAFGGTPVNLSEIATHVQKGIAAGLTLGVIAGLSNVYPALRKYVQDSLTKAGKELYKIAQEHCFADFMLAAVSKDVLGREYWKVDSPLAETVPSSVLKELVMGDKADQIPTAPLHIMQSLGDEVVPTKQVDDLVDNWASRGASIEYIRDETPGHVVLCFTGLPSTLKWLKARVAGEKSVSKPGKATVVTVKNSLFINENDIAKETREYVAATHVTITFADVSSPRTQCRPPDEISSRRRWTSSRTSLGSSELESRGMMFRYCAQDRVISNRRVFDTTGALRTRTFSINRRSSHHAHAHDARSGSGNSALAADASPGQFPAFGNQRVIRIPTSAHLTGTSAYTSPAAAATAARR